MTLVDGHFNVVVDGIERVASDLLGDRFGHFLVALSERDFKLVLNGIDTFDFQGAFDRFK